jgi:putative ABC transport system substrate-binding protein
MIPLGKGQMAIGIGRRHFISVLGGATLAWPLAAQAQQAERVRRIGVLFGAAAGDPVTQLFYSALLQGLQQLSWTDGHNIHIEPRYAAGNAADLRKYASEPPPRQPPVPPIGSPRTDRSRKGRWDL